MAEEEPKFGVFECDESYLNGIRKGRRGGRAAGKTWMSSILKPSGMMHTLPVAGASSRTLLATFFKRASTDSLVYTNNLPSYNVSDISGFSYRRTNHLKTFVNTLANHVNGIEHFWISQADHAQYNNIPPKHFVMFEN